MFRGGFPATIKVAFVLINESHALGQTAPGSDHGETVKLRVSVGHMVLRQAHDIVAIFRFCLCNSDTIFLDAS